MAMGSRKDLELKKILGRSASVVQHITWKGKDYAAKVSPADSALTAIREFAALDQMNGHPNIPKVFCFERCESTECILILDYIAGHDVKKLLDDGLKLDADLARSIATQLLNAAAHAHSCGVAHRDISLDNLIFDVERKQTVLIDWNMALMRFEKNERPKQGVTVTQHGYSMGFGGYADGACTTRLPAGRRASVDGIDSPQSPLHAETVDLYGKFEYRAPSGYEGNWLQQDAYACGVVLAKLVQAAPSFQCPVVRDVITGLLAAPEARMSVAQAAAALVDLGAP
jgi:serine/threonine protein kinase